jgi:proteic killer suppression protein
VIRSFATQGTEDVFNGVDSKVARRTCSGELLAVARRKLDQLDNADDLRDMASPPKPPGYRLEALKGNRAGQHSVRINDQYRICFRWTDDGPEDVEIVDYH